MIEKAPHVACAVLSVLCLLLVQGCVRPAIRSKATISDSPEWKIIEKCGYKCYPLVDFLTGTDLTIRVEPYNNLLHNIRNNIFVIQVWFFSESGRGFEFDPSLATVQLPDRKMLKAKGLPCSQTIMDLSYLRAASPFVGSIPIERNACFYLFFDWRPPTVETEFVLKLQGIKRLDQPVNVPEIVFRKGSGWTGFWSE